MKTTITKTTYLVIMSAFMMFGIVAQADAKWPEKPITTVIQHSAGGGTDLITRGYTKAMQKYLGATINCINRPGALGSLANDFVWAQPADGYWWVGASQYSKPHRVMGYTKLEGWKDWQYYKCAEGFQAFAVRPDSPFKTMADFLDAARKNPGKYSMCHPGVGGIWHEGNELLIREAKIKVRQIGYAGGAPGVLAGLQGEVDVISAEVGEMIEFIRAGKLRSLCAFTKETLKLPDGTVFRPITEFVPGLAPYSPFVCEYTLGVKRDTPVEILEKIRDAFIAAVDDPEFKKLMVAKNYVKALYLGEDADRQFAFRESVTAWLFWDLKIEGVKVNPADLGIPKPLDFDRWWPPKGYKPRIKSK